MSLEKPHILILAAGQGKRMHSKLPKVLHPVLFHPMLHHVLDLSFSLPHASISVVVGHGRDQVIQACKKYSQIQFFHQEEQKGTAHAVGVAKDFLKTVKGHVLILSGDVCLLQKESLEDLINFHFNNQQALTFLTAHLPEPKGYGRIVRNEKGTILAIREEADASLSEKKITEINAGIYCFEIKSLLDALENIQAANQQNEYYLTDAVSYLIENKNKVEGLSLSEPTEIHGVNDREALHWAEKVLQKRTNERLMREGVTLHLSETILIDPHCKLAPDVEIGPGTQISQSRLERGVVIEGFCKIHACHLEEGAHIKQGSYLEGSLVGKEAKVGPYAHLRPESKLSRGVKIGNFVEIKKSTIGEDSKASHLSYIGDAEVGKNVNIGCGFITCNFDGKNKHKTVIEDEVFVGSDTQAVAPLTIGKGSYVASGTTLTKNVPPDSLALSRVKQENKEGYSKRLRKVD